jgi:hypothetical protein
LNRKRNTLSGDERHYVLASKFSDVGSAVHGTSSETNRTHPESTWYGLESAGDGRTLTRRVGGTRTVEMSIPTIAPATTQRASSIIQWR